MNMPNMQMSVLQCGECETLKASVHASALALSALMGFYNAAAWLSRRDRHLAVNAILYTALAAWEHKHVAHHVRALRRLPAATERDVPEVPTVVARIAA